MFNGIHFARHVRPARVGIFGFILLLAMNAAAEPATTLDRELTPDLSLPVPQLRIDSTGALAIEASPTSSAHDFDYLVGNWKLKNRKLKSRLTNSQEWISFESKVEMQQILNGVKARLLEIGGLARTDALQILQGHPEHVVRHQLLVNGEAPWLVGDAADLGWQLERVVHRRPLRIVARTSKEVDQLIDERSRDRHAADLGALQFEAPLAVARDDAA